MCVNCIVKTPDYRVFSSKVRHRKEHVTMRAERDAAVAERNAAIEAAGADLQRVIEQREALTKDVEALKQESARLRRQAQGSQHQDEYEHVHEHEQQAMSLPSDEAAHRFEQLSKVFAAFDLDNSGTIGADELFELGTARRTLRQKSGEWTAEQNTNMIHHMKKGKPGEVRKAEFIEYFTTSLPYDKNDFDTTIKQIMLVAESVTNHISPYTHARIRMRFGFDLCVSTVS